MLCWTKSQERAKQRRCYYMGHVNPPIILILLYIDTTRHSVSASEDILCLIVAVTCDWYDTKMFQETDEIICYFAHLPFLHEPGQWKAGFAGCFSNECFIDIQSEYFHSILRWFLFKWTTIFVFSSCNWMVHETFRLVCNVSNGDSGRNTIDSSEHTSSRFLKGPDIVQQVERHFYRPFIIAEIDTHNINLYSLLWSPFQRSQEKRQLLSIN